MAELDPLAIVALGREGSGEAQILPAWRDKGPELGMLMRQDYLLKKKAEAEKKAKEDEEARKMIEAFKGSQTFTYDQGTFDKNLGNLKSTFMQKASSGTLTSDEQAVYLNIATRLVGSFQEGAVIQSNWNRQQQDLLNKPDQFDYEKSMKNANYFTNYVPTELQIKAVKGKYGTGLDEKSLNLLDNDYWKIIARNEFAKDENGNRLVDNFLVRKEQQIDYYKDIQPNLKPLGKGYGGYEEGYTYTGTREDIIKITEEVDNLLKTDIGIRYVKQEVEKGRQPDPESVRKFMIDDVIARTETDYQKRPREGEGTIDDITIDLSKPSNIKTTQLSTEGRQVEGTSLGWQLATPGNKNVFIQVDAGVLQDPNQTGKLKIMKGGKEITINVEAGKLYSADGTKVSGNTKVNVGGGVMTYKPVAQETIKMKDGTTILKDANISDRYLAEYKTKGNVLRILRVHGIATGKGYEIPANFDITNSPELTQWAEENNLKPTMEEDDYETMMGIKPAIKTTKGETTYLIKGKSYKRTDPTLKVYTDEQLAPYLVK